MWPVGHRFRFAIERHVFAVSHHTDDLRRHVFVLHIDRRALANRIFAGKILAGEGFVDDYNVSFLCRLPLSKKAALLDWNLHRAEIIGVGHTNPGLQLLSVRSFRPASDLYRNAGMWTIEWQETDGPECFHVRERLQLTDCLFEEI